jgi:hypothetical protein
MRLYKEQHRFYAGVDLHARSLFTHILDDKGRTVFEKDLPAAPDAFLQAVRPFRRGLVVGCECMFAWYWLADLCEDHSIPFVLGHALYMKMIHGSKSKNDKIDAAKLAGLLRGGLFPMAYVYPPAKRQTRDLLRRRSFFVRQRAQLIAHIQNTNIQFNLPPFLKKLSYAGNRTPEIAERFSDASTRLSVTADLNMIDAYDGQIARLMGMTVKRVRRYLRRSVPGLEPGAQGADTAGPVHKVHRRLGRTRRTERRGFVSGLGEVGLSRFLRRVAPLPGSPSGEYRPARATGGRADPTGRAAAAFALQAIVRVHPPARGSEGRRTGAAGQASRL